MGFAVHLLAAVYAGERVTAAARLRTGTGHRPLHVAASIATTAAALVAGVLLFNRFEKTFVDVVLRDEPADHRRARRLEGLSPRSHRCHIAQGGTVGAVAAPGRLKAAAARTSTEVLVMPRSLSVCVYCGSRDGSDPAGNGPFPNASPASMTKGLPR